MSKLSIPFSLGVNATMTPVQRTEGLGAVLTEEQIAEWEGARQQLIDTDAAKSDPDREAPPVGGVSTGDPLFDSATGGTGGYNYFYIDAGDTVAIKQLLHELDALELARTRPGGPLLPAGRAASDLHAVPVADLPE